jgi:hypothetical protein
MVDDRLALGDQIDYLHLEVRQRALKRADTTLCDVRKPASPDLTEDVEVSLTDGLMDQATNSLFSSADTQVPSRRAWRRKPGRAG